MKYLKLFEGFENIDDICQKYGITNYTINSDGSIDVDVRLYVNSSVDLSNENLDKIPLKFNRVSGNFYCDYNKLKTLEGVPKEVGGFFDCANNQLTSLEGSPANVNAFDCSRNQLTSLRGAPKIIGGYFNCRSNRLTTLEGAPKEVGSFYYKYNPLPKLLYDNEKYIKEIIKWQDEYNIWRDGKLDEFRFGEMMIDIKNEVGS